MQVVVVVLFALMTPCVGILCDNVFTAIEEITGSMPLLPLLFTALKTEEYTTSFNYVFKTPERFLDYQYRNDYKICTDNNEKRDQKVTSFRVRSASIRYGGGLESIAIDRVQLTGEHGQLVNRICEYETGMQFNVALEPHRPLRLTFRNIVLELFCGISPGYDEEVFKNVHIPLIDFHIHGLQEFKVEMKIAGKSCGKLPNLIGVLSQVNLTAIKLQGYYPKHAVKLDYHQFENWISEDGFALLEETLNEVINMDEDWLNLLLSNADNLVLNSMINGLVSRFFVKPPQCN